jgi:hypothetical protein
MKRPVLHGTATALCLALAVFALATQRMLVRGGEELRASDVAFDAGQLDAAIRHARRAATSYVPGAAHVDAAYERLRAVAMGAERARDSSLARSAWRAVRAAALETRHVWSPRGRELEQADSNLARLDGVGVASAPAPLLLDENRAPEPIWVVALGLGFAGAWTGLAWLFWGGIAASGHWVVSRMRLPALLFSVGLIVFGLALARA